MAEVVIDTNVIYVAEGKHDGASGACELACINRLLEITSSANTPVVIDDNFRILGEYQHKLDLNRDRGPGAKFLKWLLQNQANPKHIAMVPLNDRGENQFAEFPVATLEEHFDPSDRKFPAASNAHPNKPPILQAVDCKWLRWWPDLAKAGVRVEFLCPSDAKRYYQKKFPREPAPNLP